MKSWKSGLCLSIQAIKLPWTEKKNKIFEFKYIKLLNKKSYNTF